MTGRLGTIRNLGLGAGIVLASVLLIQPIGVATGAPDSPVSTTAAVCDGNGTSGKRVQLIYVRGQSDADRYAQFAPQFQRFADTIDSYVLTAAQASGGTRRVRYVHDASCRPIVDNVVLTNAQMAGPSTIANALSERGYNSVDRNYLFWYERSGCGVAFGGGGDDRPGTDNPYNNGRHFAALGTGCWTWQASAHELLHSLGAVQRSAPHATAHGHCWDDQDIMCYDDGGVPNPPGGMENVCGGDENQIDCNKDDYFNVNPPAGSYLATHWNVARNKFLIGA